MTRFGETLIDMAMDIAFMMRRDNFTCLDDSRELVNRIHIAAEEFELVDFDESDDYFIEQEKAADALYKELIDEKLIGEHRGKPEPTPTASELKSDYQRGYADGRAKAIAVAPQSVIKEIDRIARRLIRHGQHCDAKTILDALNRIIELPPYESGVDDWVTIHFYNRHGDSILGTYRTEKELLLMDAHRLIRAAQEDER